ncbi:MAG: Hsp70 family protein [Thermoguttaceae bacterium]|jgi:molecular chaperone DnaK|nr:Hsp70 family protein [Thermoguttaceae bacterium]
MADGTLVGIDLGTTMSAIARLDRDGTPETIANEANDPLTPSVIYLEGNRAVVGKVARDAAADAPDQVAMFVKRDMGSPAYSRRVDGRVLRPETLSAILLRKMRMDAERRIGGPISRAVITVPAFFDDVRRNATQDAGRIAGLEVYDLLNEPTAAALAYAMQAQRRAGHRTALLDVPGGSMTALVFDLGGGTLDVTVVRLRSKHFETIATEGEVQLGGKDWDEKIVEHAAREFERRFGSDPAEDPSRRARLMVQAEKAKIFLSAMPSARMEVVHAGRSLELTITRKEFEAMTAGLVERARVATELVVRKEAKLAWDQIDTVLMVGGSTRMPMIKDMLRKLCGKEPSDQLDPDQVVAHGAAIHASILAAKAGEGTLPLEESIRSDFQSAAVINVNSHNLGIEANRPGRGTVNSVLIPKNTQIPFAQSRVFYLPAPGMTKVQVRVLEGDAEEAAYCTCIGDCWITGLPPDLPKKAPVQVRLAYGADGRVGVMALDMTHGTFARTEIQRASKLSDEEVRREAEFVASLEIH